MSERPDSPLESRETPGGSDPATGMDTDLPVHLVLACALSLAVVLAATAGASWAIFGVERHRLTALDPKPSPIARATLPAVPAGPLLQRNPPADMAALLAEETAALQGYGWADEEAGTARIPIDRAIDLMADKGVRAALSGTDSPSPGGGP